VPDKIRISELRRMLGDPEVPEGRLRPYAKLDPDQSGPFAPVLVPDPETVEDEGPEAAGILASLNAASRIRRQHRYRRKLKGWDGLRIVSEGDSWFQYPLLLDDVIDHLFDRYAIYSLGAAGDRLAEMLERDEITRAIERETPHLLFLSGGGNDLVHDGHLARILRSGDDPERAPEAYLAPAFETFTDQIASSYSELFERMASRFPWLKILVHGYDYAVPAGGKWLGQPMESIGIRDRDLQRSIVRVLIDRLNEKLAELANKFPNAFHVDCRGAVPSNCWHDELHPDDAGYAAVARRFEAAVERAGEAETPAEPRDGGFVRNLDSTVISIPLLELMAKDESEDAEEAIIIEINLLHTDGRSETKRRVVDMVRNVNPQAKIQEKLASDMDQYVFATLTNRQIRALAVKNEEIRHQGAGDRSDGGPDPSGQRSRSLRPIYKIWPDFEGEILLTESVSTVKADAALAAFAGGGRGIVWAVIDTGVDARHRHFEAHQNLVLRPPLSHMDFTSEEPRILTHEELADNNGHGTHVAGIIAGECRATEERPLRAVVTCRDEDGKERTEARELDVIRGVAPECRLVSLKVADNRGRVTTKRILAALGYIRRINGDGRMPKIHGVNISLGHEFKPEWFGCGQSPVCVEVDRLVRSGTTVVVAAGNGGYGRIEPAHKPAIQAGLSNTIRDPGNADLAITVGSTHRDMAHVYGVSYFSAKGPTGDGRLKPDIVAPGEKIISARAMARRDRLPECDYGEDSGTSMAAPHISGCVAAFLSIRREFQQTPERVKEIFLSTATDLGRDRYYQGNGLVDLMRAIQSV
jgi:subtilisin family serine protease/lysophospholipase L1-like esterase